MNKRVESAGNRHSKTQAEKRTVLPLGCVTQKREEKATELEDFTEDEWISDVKLTENQQKAMV